MDYYQILGVERGASDAEIKRAYRRLARQYHPGINPGDRAAAALFRRVTEAYETLGDPVRRSQYDQAGSRTSAPSQESSTFEFAGFDFSVAAQGPQAVTFTELFADVLHALPGSDRTRPETGADLHASLTLSFVDALRGGQRQVVVTRQVPCDACRGTGQVTTSEGRCVHCQATGKVRWARGHMVFSKTCAACGGTGKQRFQRCAVCGGHGRGVRTEAIPVPVPAGIDDGGRIRVPEKGHAGRHGGRTGDLYVTVTVQPHPAFRRVGDDILLTVPIAVHEAVLGARIEVPSLEGPIRVRIPPGTQAGQRFRLSGRGVPTTSGARGDLIVEATLVLPAMVDERSKELMREFGRLNAEDVRKGLMQLS